MVNVNSLLHVRLKSANSVKLSHWRSSNPHDVFRIGAALVSERCGDAKDVSNLTMIKSGRGLEKHRARHLCLLTKKVSYRSNLRLSC